MEQIHGFDFFKLTFDREGRLEQQPELGKLLNHAGNATDAVFIAHGFRNSEQDASNWYSRFLETFRSHLKSPEFKNKLGPRRWVVAGVYWPSKSLPEGPSDAEGQAQSLEGDEEAQREFVQAQLEELREELPAGDKRRIDEAIRMLSQLKGSTDAQDRFVDKLLSVAEDKSLDANEGLEFIRSKSGSDVFDSLSTRRRRRIRTDDGESEGGVGTAAQPVAAVDDEGAAQGLGTFFGGVFGKAARLVNMTTWFVMKARSGTVGAEGMAKAVRDLKASHGEIKLHLVGHSLGGRLMAACAKSLGSRPVVQPDSVTLLQAAFSHYGFSKAKGHRGEGFFRSVVEKRVVKGPLVATFSTLDPVVGTVYAVASMLAGDNTKKLGDKDSQFGGIGRNGCQEMTEILTEKLHAAGTPYLNLSKTGVVHCLDGSENLITNHGDITNPNVTYAFASAVSAT